MTTMPRPRQMPWGRKSKGSAPLARRRFLVVAHGLWVFAGYGKRGVGGLFKTQLRLASCAHRDGEREHCQLLLHQLTLGRLVVRVPCHQQAACRSAVRSGPWAEQAEAGSTERANTRRPVSTRHGLQAQRKKQPILDVDQQLLPRVPWAACALGAPRPDSGPMPAISGLHCWRLSSSDWPARRNRPGRCLFRRVQLPHRPCISPRGQSSRLTSRLLWLQ